MPHLLLIQNVDGLGNQFEVVQVDDDQALDLCVKRVALHLTPLVRKRFSGLIRESAGSSSPSAL